MARQGPKSPRARLFVALDLPENLREGIVGWSGEALVDPALRPVAPESLHLTLAFLGSRPEEEIPEIAAIVQAAAGAAPWVELRDPVQRPVRGRARLFALPVLSPGAEVLQATLAQGLADRGFYRPEKRPFWPHVTVARVRPEGRGSRRPAVVSGVPGPIPRQLSEPRIAIRMALYRSDLQPTGARYVPLAQIELPGQGSSEVIEDGR